MICSNRHGLGEETACVQVCMAVALLASVRTQSLEPGPLVGYAKSRVRIFRTRGERQEVDIHPLLFYVLARSVNTT